MTCFGRDASHACIWQRKKKHLEIYLAVAIGRLKSVYNCYDWNYSDIWSRYTTSLCVLHVMWCCCDVLPPCVQMWYCIFYFFSLQLWITRIAAATREHGMKYPALMHNLTKVGFNAHYCHKPLWYWCRWLTRLCSLSTQSSVQLNRRVISDLAITEPRTFLSLAKLARARQQEGFCAALGDGREPPGVLSRVVMLQ